MTELFFILLFAAGVLVLYQPLLTDLRRAGMERLKQGYQNFFCSNEENDLRQHCRRRIPEHIRQLLQVTLSMGTEKGVNAFLLVSAGLAAASFAATAGNTSLFLSFAAACAAAALPYLLLRCMVQKQRVTGSREGEILVTELLNCYKIYYCNMTRAIEAAAGNLEGAPYSRKLLFNLSRGLNRISSGAELEVLLAEFRFALNTSWADILAANIYLACYQGVRVSESLADLAKSMEQARKLEEFCRRENNEARMILRYLIPAASLLLSLCGIRFLGLTFRQWLSYQFGTSTGITWFLLCLLSYLSAAGVHILLTNRKFDL